jgi:hypothetical protein
MFIVATLVPAEFVVVTVRPSQRIGVLTKTSGAELATVLGQLDRHVNQQTNASDRGVYRSSA